MGRQTHYNGCTCPACYDLDDAGDDTTQDDDREWDDYGPSDADITRAENAYETRVTNPRD